MTGIYVHFPFCTSRCIYCGFYSTVGKEALQDSYISALKQELARRKDYVGEDPDGRYTLYYGGGTPSVVKPQLLAELTKAIQQEFHMSASAIEEFTIECNPDDIASEGGEHLCAAMKKMGVNRVSMGVQTFSDERLRFLGRRHRAAQIPQAIDTLRKAGIENISIDLMFGFPDETLHDWQSDLHKALSLSPEHISAYSLMYEEGTPLYRMLEEGKIKENDEETCRQMYETLINTLTQAGYEHYEISNFAKPGYRSRHNSSYWNDTHYLGLGAAAHSYNGKSRTWNISNVSQYIDGEDNSQYEPIDARTHYNDTVTTALRTRDGIAIESVTEPYRSYLISNAQSDIQRGNLIIENNHLHLTRQGLFISDDVMSNLIWV